MFSTDQNLSALRDLIEEIKEYLSMRYELAKLDLVSKFTVLIATFFLCIVLMFLAGVALLFVSYGLAQSMAEWLGSESMALLAVAGIYLLIACCVYVFRKQIIIRPLAKFLSELFLDPVNRKEEQNEEN